MKIQMLRVEFLDIEHKSVVKVVCEEYASHFSQLRKNWENNKEETGYSRYKRKYPLSSLHEHFANACFGQYLGTLPFKSAFHFSISEKEVIQEEVFNHVSLDYFKENIKISEVSEYDVSDFSGMNKSNCVFYIDINAGIVSPND